MLFNATNQRPRAIRPHLTSSHSGTRPVFIGEPPRTQYDLRFSIFGTPVRVHPFFWIAAAVIGGSLPDIYMILAWILAMFISIIVHEFGHVWAMQYYGISSRVVLYMMGGLAIQDTGGWGKKSSGGRGPTEQIVISAAGPAAGFILAGLVLGILRASGVPITLQLINYMPAWPELYRAMGEASVAGNQNRVLILQFANSMLFINIFWGLLNLMPIYPLDGGQISRELFLKHDAWNGLKNSLMLSIGAAGGLVVFAISNGSFLMAIMFGSLAVGSWQMLQQINGRGGGFGGGRPW